MGYVVGPTVPVVPDGSQDRIVHTFDLFPLVGAISRRQPDIEDGNRPPAAVGFDPQRIDPERWASYAWTTVTRTRWRGVDDAGVVTRRDRVTPPTTVTIDGWDQASPTPGPSEIVEQQDSITAITHAVGQLPPSLREPLLESMRGQSARTIGEAHGFTDKTARRRIQQARDQIRAGLASRPEDRAWEPFAAAADPVMDRAQRLFERTLPPSLGLDPTRGPLR